MLRPLARGAVRSLCSQCRLIAPIHNNHHPFIPLRRLQTSTSPDRVPLRKQLKQDAKALKAQKRQRKESEEASRQEWELTVGVEIHAQLDTAAKLFSRAPTSSTDAPNSNVALFDLAFPGSQPVRIPISCPIELILTVIPQEFQAATLLPALRAAVALNCQIQPVSRFDRKHYFYQDQPAGYQITQYYGW
jgi:aspartyl-tRNA(Asn)/glutamyl-tRNA(Gln) amidotransferase subunit B